MDSTRRERERAWRGEREDAAGERDRRERDGARCKREEVLMARVFLFSGISAEFHSGISDERLKRWMLTFIGKKVNRVH